MLEPKKSKWLQEVEDDAVRITNRRFKEQFEEMEYQNAKKEEEQVVETPPEEGISHEPEIVEPPKKHLKQMNKSELQELADDEDVEIADEATNAQIVQAIEDKRKDT